MKETTTPFDLEQRTYQFALRVRVFLKGRDWHRVNWSDVTQLLGSSGSVAANYVEPQEAVRADDFTYRIRLCRKETRESSLWLRLLNDTNEMPPADNGVFSSLLGRTGELARIFTSILRKRETPA